MPEVNLATTAGRDISFAAPPGKVVVFCYPWTGRPGLPDPSDWDLIPGAHGSTAEAEGFRNLHAAFLDLEVAVFGLSTQTVEYQRELVARLALPFELVSDAGGRFRHALDLPTFEAGGVTYLKRLTLVVCAGRLKRVFYPVHPPDAHAREVVAWLSAEAGYAIESRLRDASSAVPSSVRPYE
jgi:peroxiredoxin